MASAKRPSVELPTTWLLKSLKTRMDTALKSTTGQLVWSCTRCFAADPHSSHKRSNKPTRRSRSVNLVSLKILISTHQPRVSFVIAWFWTLQDAWTYKRCFNTSFCAVLPYLFRCLSAHWCVLHKITLRSHICFPSLKKLKPKICFLQRQRLLKTSTALSSRSSNLKVRSTPLKKQWSHLTH